MRVKIICIRPSERMKTRFPDFLIEETIKWIIGEFLRWKGSEADPFSFNIQGQATGLRLRALVDELYRNKILSL